METIQEKYIALSNAINKNKIISINKMKVGGPTDKVYKEIVLERVNFKLTHKINELHTHGSTIICDWDLNLENVTFAKYSNDDTLISGYLKTFDIGSFVSFDENLLSAHWAENFDEEELKDLKNFRLFESGDEMVKIGFFIENNKLVEEMYFMLAGESGFSKAPFNFDEFIDLMVKYKGFLGWQYNILFPDCDNAKRMRYYIKKIFGAA